MAHIFFEKLENRRNTQSLSTALGSYSIPTSAPTGVYAAPGFFPSEQQNWSYTMPISYPAPIYAGPDSPLWKTQWTNPWDINPFIPMYAVGNPWDSPIRMPIIGPIIGRIIGMPFPFPDPFKPYPDPSPRPLYGIPDPGPQPLYGILDPFPNPDPIFQPMYGILDPPIYAMYAAPDYWSGLSSGSSLGSNTALSSW